MNKDKFMISIHLWNLWFGWATEFAGKKNTFFGCTLTKHKSFGFQIVLDNY